MANQHYHLDEEIEVTIKVKVKIKSVSNYSHLNELQLADNVSDFKHSIAQHLTDKLRDDYYEEVTLGVDYWDYEVK